MLTFWTWEKIGISFHWDEGKEGQISDDASEIQIKSQEMSWKTIPAGFSYLLKIAGNVMCLGGNSGVGNWGIRTEESGNLLKKLLKKIRSFLQGTRKS